jgi:hypothetical protein
MELPQTGARVLHPLFGEGIVRDVSGSGPGAKITVEFSPSVGRKKLLAGVAKLTLAGESSGERTVAVNAPAPAATAWVEALDTTLEAPRGKLIPRERVREDLENCVHSHGFWSAVREHLRSCGFAPRVIDDISGQFSFCVDAGLKLRIRIRHRELLKPDQRVLAPAILAVLRQRYLSQFEPPRVTTDFGIHLSLDTQHVVELQDEDLGELSPRAPLRRPLREQPKGVIRSRPKGWNDAR